MSLLKEWIRRRAAKRMADRLANTLAVSYGGSDYYTIPQINVAYNSLHLNLKYIEVAYAAYLEFEKYADLTGFSREMYENSRNLYKSFLPDKHISPVSPAPMNEYVKQLGGFQ